MCIWYIFIWRAHIYSYADVAAAVVPKPELELADTTHIFFSESNTIPDVQHAPPTHVGVGFHQGSLAFAAPVPESDTAEAGIVAGFGGTKSN